MNLATGVYTGTGVDNHSITGVGFQPTSLFIRRIQGDDTLAWKTSSMGASSGWPAQTWAMNNTAIKSLDADGFTLGPLAQVNTAGGLYVWVAMAGTGAPADFEVGSYVGNGSDPRTITLAAGFQPNFVMVQRAGGARAVVYTEDIVGDLSLYFANLAGVTNRIQSIVATGFTVGDDNEVNSNGITYYYLAAKAVADTCRIRSFTGDDAASRDVLISSSADSNRATLAAFLFVEENNERVFRTAAMGEAYDALAYGYVDGEAVTDHVLQMFISTDLSRAAIGASLNVNGKTYHVLCLGCYYTASASKGGTSGTAKGVLASRVDVPSHVKAVTVVLGATTMS